MKDDGNMDMNFQTSTSEDIERDRESAIDDIMDGEHTPTIVMEALPDTVDYGFLDDVYDADGDSIIATRRDRFRIYGSGLVEASFAQGTDPIYVARVLRKFADMLSGPEGRTIANMAQEPGNVDYAQRLTDGSVRTLNLPELIERADREKGRGDKDDDGLG